MFGEPPRKKCGEMLQMLQMLQTLHQLAVGLLRLINPSATTATSHMSCPHGYTHSVYFPQKSKKIFQKQAVKTFYRPNNCPASVLIKSIPSLIFVLIVIIPNDQTYKCRSKGFRTPASLSIISAHMTPMKKRQKSLDGELQG